MYKHITKEERASIALLLSRKKSFAYIAQELGVHRSTIAREYHRNKEHNGTYYARNAQKRANMRNCGKQETRKVIENNHELYKYVVTSLTHYWSPEQIAGRIRKDGRLPHISHTTIYKFIDREGKDLRKYRRHKKHRKLSEISYKQALKHMIDTRPRVVDDRSRIGDWEGDTIVGKERTERILTHVDRKSGLLLAHRTKADSHSVRLAVRRVFSVFPCATITYDNGSEFAAFEKIEEDTHSDVYFAYPGKPQQRGCNENCNGLLRQFFPKGSSFANITQKQVDEVVGLINNRPRKRLGYRTPLEVFLEELECCT